MLGSRAKKIHKFYMHRRFFSVAVCRAFISSHSLILVTVLNTPVKKLNEIYIVSLTSLASTRNEKKSNLQGTDAQGRTHICTVISGSVK